MSIRPYGVNREWLNLWRIWDRQFLWRVAKVAGWLLWPLVRASGHRFRWWMVSIAPISSSIYWISELNALGCFYWDNCQEDVKKFAEVAARLVGLAEKVASERQTSITTIVHPGNKEALELYRSLGYEEMTAFFKTPQPVEES